MKPISPRLKAAFRASAWGMLAIIVLGYVSLIPALDGRIVLARSTLVGRVVIGTFLILCALDAVVLWGTALWYAWDKGPNGSLPRVVRIAFLLIGNFVFAFFYYFVVVARERKTTASRA